MYKKKTTTIKSVSAPLHAVGAVWVEGGGPKGEEEVGEEEAGEIARTTGEEGDGRESGKAEMEGTETPLVLRFGIEVVGGKIRAGERSKAEAGEGGRGRGEGGSGSAAGGNRCRRVGRVGGGEIGSW